MLSDPDLMREGAMPASSKIPFQDDSGEQLEPVPTLPKRSRYDKKTPRLRSSSVELLALVSIALITSSCTTPKKSDPSTHLAPSVSSS